MKDYGFSECKSAAEIMEVLERLSVIDICELITLNQCSGSKLAEKIAKIAKSKGFKDSEIARAKKNDLSVPDIVLDMEGNVTELKGVPVNLSEDQIEQALIFLKQKQLDERIRSDKVVEGVLKDIQGGIDRLADSAEWLNNYKCQERKNHGKQ